MIPDDRQITPQEAFDLQTAMQHRALLLIWTVTTGTDDFGTCYAARPHRVSEEGTGPLPVYLIADTLDELRDMLPPGLTRLARQSDDNAVIVENWL
jgi:hypothetical protein